MSIGAVFFDAGNTLLDLDHDAIASLCLRHGLEVRAEAIRRTIGTARPAMDRFLAAGPRSSESSDTRVFAARLILDGLAVPEEQRAAGLLAELSEMLPRLFRRPPDDAAETLETLRARGYRLAVVSNSDGSVEQGLADAGLRSILEFVIDSSVVGVEKPDPGIFTLAVERMGVLPSEAVYVGDLPSIDVKGALAAGLLAVLLDPFDNFGGCPAPRIQSLSDLPTLLARL